MSTTAVPDNVKRLRGTAQKCRISRAVGSDWKLVPDQPPVGLPDDAKDAWAIAIQSAPDGMLTALDVATFERWCRAYALYRRYTGAVEKNGATYVTESGQQRPTAEFIVMQSLSAELTKLEKELGFTPCARAKVKVQTEDETEGNPFAEA